MTDIKAFKEMRSRFYWLRFLGTGSHFSPNIAFRRRMWW